MLGDARNCLVCVPLSLLVFLLELAGLESGGLELGSVFALGLRPQRERERGDILLGETGNVENQYDESAKVLIILIALLLFLLAAYKLWLDCTRARHGI